MPRETVLAEIAKCPGTQFDPAIAPAFVSLDLTDYDELLEMHSKMIAAAA